MGADYRYWRRAKFFERYRLFFRYKEADRLIVLVWVNDGSTLRERGARNDVYNVFKKMLGSGTPPSTWSDLVAECQRLRPFRPNHATPSPHPLVTGKRYYRCTFFRRGYPGWQRMTREQARRPSKGLAGSRGGVLLVSVRPPADRLAHSPGCE